MPATYTEKAGRLNSEYPWEGTTEIGFIEAYSFRLPSSLILRQRFVLVKKASEKFSRKNLSRYMHMARARPPHRPKLAG